MKRKHKQYSRPRRLHDKTRIVEEKKIRLKYGLKNNREIWKAAAKVKYFRDRAKLLLEASHDEQQHFFVKLNALGLQVASVTDVLALQTEDVLKRRLATVVATKKLAYTPKHARQMIVHKKVTVNGRVMNVPGYIVPTSEEEKIALRKKAPKPVKVETPVEQPSEESPVEEPRNE